MGQISYRQAKKPCKPRLIPVDLDALGGLAPPALHPSSSRYHSVDSIGGSGHR